MKKFLVTARTLVAGLVLIAAAWLLFAPAELGGATRYAVVEGANMEPGLSRGDLVLVRGGDEPDVGDAVLYRDPTLGVRVLHRVIAKEDGRLVLQGDANDFVDDARPAPSEVIGAYWFSIPRAALRTLLAATAAPCGAARVRADDRRARRRRRPSRTHGGSVHRMKALTRSGRAAVFPLVPLVIFLGVVLTASTVVPTSKAGRDTDPVTANKLKPGACAALALAGIARAPGLSTTRTSPTSCSGVQAWT